MSKEISNTETMSKAKTKKTTKKKIVKKPEVTPSPQVSIQTFDDLEGKFLLVRVGNNDRPASGEDIEDIEGKLAELLEENNVKCLAFVTHHAVEFEIIEKLK